MRRYGLIGYPLTHSFSERFFTEKFQREGINDCIYSNYPIPQIGALPEVLADPSLCGLNVTIPYKQQVIPFLQELSPVVEEIGACNCIRLGNGGLAGHNTDVIGFERSLVRKLSPEHRQALILGTGGAARAVAYVLLKLGISYRLVSRHPRPDTGELGYDGIDEEVLRDFLLIVNTSPVGMYPRVDECPPLPYDALTPRHYLFDLVYNPARTQFLLHGEARGAAVENGWDMLVIQAEESWRIWNA
ncbi:MAG TPA: shikimate dehydrogenase [Puia sp.]|nr:shikimate dehydrogenase [Puia sp.]